MNSNNFNECFKSGFCIICICYLKNALKCFSTHPFSINVSGSKSMASDYSDLLCQDVFIIYN